MTFARHPMIATEGKPFIVSSSIIVVLLYAWLGRPGLLALLPLFFVLWMFRDPRRNVPSLPLGIVSPIDGKVLSIGEEHDPYLDRQSLHIALQMSPLGMNSLRSITEGKVLNYWRGQNGGRERAIQIQTDEQDDVVVVLRPGRWLKRLSCDVVTGDRVGQGQRCGYILFGSRIDIYLPKNCRSELTNGQTIHAGSDVIGEFIRS